jgi:D-alanine transfer protein
MNPASPTARAHLLATFFAGAVAALAIAGGLLFCRQVEKRGIHAVAPEFSDAKLQGVVLQERAFAEDDLLVFYGSSELVKEMPNNAVQFFEKYPTGFRVFPVGKPGTTALAVLQKIAAVGDDIKGRKVAYSISPGCFFSEVFDPQYYEGNFSEQQAMEFAFSTELSHGLKRDVARRMLDFPRTLDDRWLLGAALRRLAKDRPFDRLFYACLAPLGYLQIAIGRAQDHFEAAVEILRHREPQPLLSRAHVSGLNWKELLARAAQFANNAAVQAKRREVAQNRATHNVRGESIFRAMLHAREWTDLELLLRTMRELGAEPLLLSMPVEDIRLEVYGADAKLRNAYVQRLDALAEQYHLRLIDFREHERDPAFLVDFLDHLSGKGWLYYDKALDDFFHGRVSSL